MPTTPDWTACTSTLTALSQMVEEIQKLALPGQPDSTPDTLAQACTELAKALASCQPGLAHALQQGTPPADVLTLLQQVKTGLNNLQEQTTRLQAGTARALNVLFPADQVQAYSRLGNKGYGAQARPGSAYLKA